MFADDTVFCGEDGRKPEEVDVWFGANRTQGQLEQDKKMREGEWRG